MKTKETTNNLIENEEKQQEEFQQYPPEKWRWVIITIFCSLSFTSGASQVLYSPIMSLCENYFEVSEFNMLWHNNIWPLSYVVLSIPVMYTLMTWKLCTSIYLAALLNAVGAWVRYLAGSNFLLAILGTSIIASAQLWFLPAPAIIIERWFPPEERQLITNIAFNFAIGMGVAVGYIYSAVYVVDDESKISEMQFYFACSTTIPFVLILLFFRENPKHFKNKIQQSDQKGFKESLITIAKPKHLFNLILLTLFVGNAWTYSSIIQNIIQPMGYGTLDIGIIGIVMNSVSTIGGIVASLIMEKQLLKGGPPKYDLFIKFFITLETVLCVVLMVVMFYYKNIDKWIMYTLSALIGLGQNAFIPFGAQAYMESVFPVNEIVSMNAFFYVSQIPNFIFVFLSVEGAWLLNAIMLPFFIYLMFFYKTVLSRFQAEQQEIQQNKKIQEDIMISMQEQQQNQLIIDDKNK